jgi:pimeloyl-ACP methyl ester carboxylesterase
MKESYSARGIYYRNNIFEPGRPTLVFVHGLTGSSSAWLRYEEKFKDDFNLLMFDLRGHGTSVKPTKMQDYELKEFTADLHEIVVSLAIKKFIFVSHSFGTVTALDYIRTYPEEIQASVFLNPVLDSRRIRLARLIRPLLRLAASFMSIVPFSGGRGIHIDYSKFYRTGDWNVFRMAADIPNTSFHVYFYCLAYISSFASADFIYEADFPILIIHGSKDTVVPVHNSIEAVAHMKRYELVILPDAAHITVLNDFEDVSEEIFQFARKYSDR